MRNFISVFNSWVHFFFFNPVVQGIEEPTPVAIEEKAPVEEKPIAWRHREPSLQTVHDDAVDIIMQKSCKLIQCARVHLEHAQMQLGYPEMSYDMECEEEVKPLVSSFLENLADELPVPVRHAILSADQYGIVTDHNLECMEIPVQQSAREKLLEAAK